MIEIVQGDITKPVVDAIVNAANGRMPGGENALDGGRSSGENGKR